MITSPLMTFICDALLKYPQAETDGVAQVAPSPTAQFERQVALNALLHVLRGDPLMWRVVTDYVSRFPATPTGDGGTSAFMTPRE